MGPAGAAAASIVGASMGCRAGGQFDGQWMGTAPEADDCDVLMVTLTIVGDRITGTARAASGRNG
jgi:hypothetical protein